MNHQQMDAEQLKAAGIGTGIHYPIPLHLQKAYTSLKYSLADFPVARSAADEIVSLPMYPQLTVDQQARVAEEILAFTSKTARKQVEVNETSFATAEQTETIRQKYLAGNFGYGHAKQALLELILEKYKNEREAYNQYMQGDHLEKVLSRCEEKATLIATEVIERVRKKVGFF